MGSCLSCEGGRSDGVVKESKTIPPIALSSYDGERINPDAPRSSSFADPHAIGQESAGRPFPASAGCREICGTDYSSHINPPMPRNVSELIDPETLINEGAMVQSPSGSLLTRDAFYAREDRPLSMRERQERIRMQMLQSQNQNYAISGIPDRSGSGQPSPSDFAMYDIVEEDASAPNSPESKKGRKGGFTGYKSKVKPSNNVFYNRKRASGASDFE